ncbi:MAG TPA: SatD family protein [Candidatus Agrococcus pullicola]|uniref:SatD family protein n=1 Tax=Candidatus Agrococcus pullicola TaxID=2838429 RepID=A0A9D2CB53_9MICO|nr:SatD family protein [Candidatus Agrococcus pullicola]
MRELSDTYEADLLLPIAHYAGDELQFVSESATAVTAISLEMSDDAWYVGIGVGAGTLGETAADSHGAAFEFAREAVIAAKPLPWGIAVRADDEELGADAEAGLALLQGIRSKRTSSGRDIAELVEELGSVTAAAQELGISVSAASKRARIALLRHEALGFPLAARLLAFANGSEVRETLKT